MRPGARFTPRARRWRAAALAAAVTATAFATAPHASGAARFTQPLRIPPTRTEADITLTARQAQVPMFGGDSPATTMWTFDGTFPGPTIRRPSGEPTRLTIVNELPSEAGEITVHHHGAHAASSEDGQPTEHLIEHGARRTYTYEMWEDGAPERAAFQWYHDHRMDVTGRNVWMGLAGMVILDDELDASLPLPKGERDVPLMIVDRAFDQSNQLLYTEGPNPNVGGTILVNGVPHPFFEVADVRYRLRLLNASNARPYEFAFSDRRPMVQIASDSGLLPTPVTRTTVTLAPAERAEVVVDFTGALGSDLVLQNLAGIGATAEVMQFRVTRDETDTTSIPATLRPAPTFAVGPTTRTRTWILGRDAVTSHWVINGRSYDPARVDTEPLNPRVGDTERWIFVNATPVDHPMHIHDVDWRIVARSRPLASPDAALAEAGLKETFVIRPGEVVEVVSRFTDHTGRYVFHCHILEHEDHAMMAQFQVDP